MAIAVVQRWSASGTANDKTIAVSGVTPGNLLVVAAIHLNSSAATVSDDGGATAWTLGTAVSEGVQTANVRFAWKIAEGTPTTITVVTPGGASSTGHVWEISGHEPDVSLVLDGQTSGRTNGTSVGSHNVSPSLSPSGNVLLCGVVASASTATFSSSPSGYTMLADTVVSRAGDRSGASGSSYDFATTTSANRFTVTMLAAFKEAAGGAVGGQPTMMRWGGVPGMVQRGFGRSW